jgi:hypothetical protein
MKWMIRVKLQLKRETWEKWFAWHPVKVYDKSRYNPFIVWLETVERRWQGGSIFDNREKGHYEYKILSDRWIINV